MKSKTFVGPIVVLILCLSFLTMSCTNVEDDTQAGSLLLVDAITGLAGGETGDPSTPLLSDTCDNDDDEVQDPEFCTVFNDNAEIEFSNQFLNVGGGAGFPPSFLNDIIVTQYRVEYFRPNGRNTPGIDVPFPVDGTLNVRVPADGTATASILVVRHQAKREPPLAELDIGSGEGVLTVNARITFFGQDVAGRNVQATGFLEIHFANYGEEE